MARIRLLEFDLRNLAAVIASMEEDTESWSREECVDLVVDCLNVSVHQILHARKLYPALIFRPHQKFNVTVYKAIHPEVVTYIDRVMDTLRKLLNDGLVDRFALVVKKEKPVKKYVFHIQSYFKASSNGKSTVSLDEVQQQMRAVWLTLGIRSTTPVQTLDNCTFSFEMYTTNVAYDGMLQKQHIEDFQWIVPGDESSASPSGVLPIRKWCAHPFSVDIYMEEYEDGV